MPTITTDQQLETEVGTFAGAGLPAAQTTTQQVQQAELLGTSSGQLGTAPTTTAAQAPLAGITTTAPTAPAATVGQIAGISLSLIHI